jgi:hypothetical protein
MSNDRVVEEYRNHKLLAAFHQGAFKGRVWNHDGLQLTELNGSGIDDLLNSLRSYVDATFVEKANARTASPEAAEYVHAFQQILEGLPASYLSMLKAHYHAPDRTITATQLADAGGYATWRTANLHYGLFGKRLYEALPIQLPANEDGTLIYTFALATEGDFKGNVPEWQWKMRPEIVEAVALMGLNT